MNSVGNNSAISYKAANIGVLTVPDGIGKVQLYSDTEADKLYREITSDIYQKQIHCIYNQTIQKILYRIIEDEQLHLQIFESFLNEYNAK